MHYKLTVDFFRVIFFLHWQLAWHAMNDLTPSISACVIVVVNDLGSSEGQITFSLNNKLCTQFWVNITNDYNSLRREQVIVRQQHCRLIMSIAQIFWRKLGFLDKIFSKKNFFLFATKFIRISRRIKRSKHHQWL